MEYSPIIPFKKFDTRTGWNRSKGILARPREDAFRKTYSGIASSTIAIQSFTDTRINSPLPRRRRHRPQSSVDVLVWHPRFATNGSRETFPELQDPPRAPIHRAPHHGG